MLRKEVILERLKLLEWSKQKKWEKFEKVYYKEPKLAIENWKTHKNIPNQMTSMIILHCFVFLKYSFTMQQRLAKSSQLPCSALSSQLLGLFVIISHLHSWKICTEYLGKIFMRVSRPLPCDMVVSVIVFICIHRYFQVCVAHELWMNMPVCGKEVDSS